VKWEPRTITARREWATGLWSLTLDGEPPAFRAGQFLNLGLELNGQVVTRSYSMASAPEAPLEFLLVRVAGGALSPHLHDLPPGAELLTAAQPAGHFTLERVHPAETLWLLATGTGLGPFVAMLRTHEPWERFARVVLVHGVRWRDHLAYRDELAALGAAHGDRLTHIPVVSREEPPAGGLAGRITTLLAEGRLEATAGATITPQLEASQVLLCGNPGLLREAGELLKARGLAKNRRRQPGQLTTEAYWQLPR
jgi:ferredoxin--NADP+ reductase